MKAGCTVGRWRNCHFHLCFNMVEMKRQQNLERALINHRRANIKLAKPNSKNNWAVFLANPSPPYRPGCEPILTAHPRQCVPSCRNTTGCLSWTGASRRHVCLPYSWLREVQQSVWHQQSFLDEERVPISVKWALIALKMDSVS